MKYYKKIAAIAPIAALSTSILFSPVSTFAAENKQIVSAPSNTASQNNIRGYLIKNGIKTPVYNNSDIGSRSTQVNEAPYPELSSNPNDPVPTKGSIASENGKVGSVLYFSKLGVRVTNPMAAGSGASSTVKFDNAYLEKKDDGSIVVGTYDPSTLKRTPLSDQKFEYDTALGMTYTFDEELAKKYFANTTVKRETAFTIIGSGVAPKNGAYEFSQAITSGLSTTDAIGGSLTLGYKLTLKAGGDILPVGATSEFSSQLTASYNHTLTVSSQVTNTQALKIPKASDTYKYDKYVGAVYQLNSSYTVVPGQELKQAIANGDAVLAQNAFRYDDSTLYLAVTPGAGS